VVVNPDFSPQRTQRTQRTIRLRKKRKRFGKDTRIFRISPAPVSPASCPSCHPCKNSFFGQADCTETKGEAEVGPHHALNGMEELILFFVLFAFFAVVNPDYLTTKNAKNAE
jgi:hypothetical protein